MKPNQIKHMVTRFLGWKLPENFSPDAGISFKAAYNEGTAHPMKHEPSGTNLFDATQTEAMVRYMAEGMPEDSGSPTPQQDAVREVVEAARHYVKIAQDFNRSQFIKENGRHYKSPWAELVEAVDALARLSKRAVPPSSIRGLRPRQSSLRLRKEPIMTTSTAKMRHCWVCGSELGVIEAKFYDREDICGSSACYREARDAQQAERDESHHQLDEGMGW